MTDDFLKKTVKRSPGFVFKKMGEEGVIIELTNNVVNMDKVYTLNEIGALIYQKLDVPKTNLELLELVLNEFDVSREEALIDLAEFISHTEKLGIISIELS